METSKVLSVDEFLNILTNGIERVKMETAARGVYLGSAQTLDSWLDELAENADCSGGTLADYLPNEFVECDLPI